MIDQGAFAGSWFSSDPEHFGIALEPVDKARLPYPVEAVLISDQGIQLAFSRQPAIEIQLLDKIYRWLGL